MGEQLTAFFEGAKEPVPRMIVRCGRKERRGLAARAKWQARERKCTQKRAKAEKLFIDE
jgi:hypothetical protein